MSNNYRQPAVLYELELGPLHLNLGNGATLDVSSILSNGRANYILFQKLTGLIAGLESHSEGGAADLIASNGDKYEVKAYTDPAVKSPNKDIHVAASSTFGPNNHGPTIRNLLRDGKYNEAYDLCYQTGFSKNDYYVFTNTRAFTNTEPFRYIILPTAQVLKLLSPKDPRIIARTDVLNAATRTEIVSANRLLNPTTN